MGEVRETLFEDRRSIILLEGLSPLIFKDSLLAHRKHITALLQRLIG
jgi:hypothetical protein